MALLDAINEVVNALGEKANCVVETTKLQASLSQQKKILAKAQLEIGEFYLKRFVEDGFIDEAVAEAAEKGQVAFKAVEDLNQQIAELEAIINTPITPGKKCCEVCGSYVDDTFNYCPICGAAFPLEDLPEEPEAEDEAAAEANIEEADDVFEAEESENEVVTDEGELTAAEA